MCIEIEQTEIKIVELEESITFKTKSPKHNSFDSKIILKDDFCHDRQKLVKVERSFDKDNNSYKEKVTDKDNGEIIHFCEEPLKEHKGHGSAKHK